MSSRPLTVAWFSYFPVEWLAEMPEYVQRLPRQHPASWQQVLLAELEERRDLKLHVLVLRRVFDQHRSFERKGVTFHLLKTPAGWRTPSLFWVDTWLIRRKLAEIKPDVLHAWGTDTGAASVAARLPYPYLLSMQGIFTWQRQLLRLPLYGRLVARLEDWHIPRAPLVTAESSFAVRYLQERYPTMHIRQVEHAPKWQFHRLGRQPQRTPLRFLFVGSISRLKGADLLLKALDTLTGEMPFQLVVAGSAEAGLVEQLRGEVSEALWSRIEWRGHLTAEQVMEELSRATLMLFASRADNSPNAVKEAVAAGVPVVASAIGGLVDYVVPGENGYLFESEDVAGLAAAIRAARQHPLFGQGQVDGATLARMREYLSPRLMGEKMLGCYRELAAGQASTGSRMAGEAS
jgi:glycosyltransferase involved in cell wall biosynthesis